MKIKTPLRFEFVITDADGNAIVSDWTTISSPQEIDQFGACEAVDIHVGAALRCARNDLIRQQIAIPEMEEESTKDT
jgi:hypothetical protein